MIKTNSFSLNQFKSNVQPVSKGKNHKKEKKTQKDKKLSTNYIQRNTFIIIRYHFQSSLHGISGRHIVRQPVRRRTDDIPRQTWTSVGNEKIKTKIEKMCENRY